MARVPQEGALGSVSNGELRANVVVANKIAKRVVSGEEDGEVSCPHINTNFGDTVNSKLVLELANGPTTSGSVATQTRLLEYQAPDVQAISPDSARDARIVNPGIVNPELHTKYAEVFNFKKVGGDGQQLERPRPTSTSKSWATTPSAGSSRNTAGCPTRRPSRTSSGRGMSASSTRTLRSLSGLPLIRRSTYRSRTGLGICAPGSIMDSLQVS